MWLAGELEPSSPSTAAVGCEPQPPGEVLEPLLGRTEAQLRLFGPRRVAVQVVIDDIARAAVELVRGERDAHVGASRPRLRDRDLALGGEPLGEPPERLARHVASAVAGRTTPSSCRVHCRSRANVRAGTTPTPGAAAGTSTADTPRPSRAATRNASAVTPWRT